LFEETDFVLTAESGEEHGKGLLDAVPNIANALKIVFVNGRFAPQLSEDIDSGTIAIPFSRSRGSETQHVGEVARWRSEALAALNQALFLDGVLIRIPADHSCDRPIHVVHIATSDSVPILTFGRCLIELERGSSATVVETFCSYGDVRNCICSVTEAIVGESARLEHTKVQVGSERAIYICEFEARVAAGGNAKQVNATFGGGLVRNSTNATLAGESATATLNGLYIARGSQHVDNHTILDHAMPHCPSHELYKGILSDSASGVFRGKIIVRPDAQKTDSKQSSMTMLLSDRATVNAMPQLEIFADDVRCTHGATIGHISDDELFYLRARGIDSDSARHLLTYAFATDVLETIGDASLREWLERAIFLRFASDNPLPSDDELHS
jgi:Fe-S cluster assembly protein SufD